MGIVPLAGITVLDMTDGVAGPFCTKLLADCGARVVKIEAPGRGDVTRRWGPFPGDAPHPERSGAFLHLNTSKLGVTLDPGTDSGRAIFKTLVGEAGAVVEGLPPGGMGAMGLDYETLRSLRPGLVMASVTAFGQTGPYRNYAWSELVLQAIAGPGMHETGTADREPRKSPHWDAQYFAGLYAASAVLGALLEARLRGTGRYLDISMAEAWMAHPIEKGNLYPYTGQRASRPPGVSRFNYLMGAYPCKDGFVAVQGSGRGESWWPRVFQLMGMPRLGEDRRFNTPEGRTAHRDELDGIWYGWLADHTREEVFAAARNARFPVAPVNRADDALRDLHFRERGIFVELDHPVAGRLTQPGVPFQLVPAAAPIRPAPLLGQHNREVYGGQMGLSGQDLAHLRREGAI